MASKYHNLPTDRTVPAARRETRETRPLTPTAVIKENVKDTGFDIKRSVVDGVVLPAAKNLLMEVVSTFFGVITDTIGKTVGAGQASYANKAYTPRNAAAINRYHQTRPVTPDRYGSFGSRKDVVVRSLTYHEASSLLENIDLKIAEDGYILKEELNELLGMASKINDQYVGWVSVQSFEIRQDGGSYELLGTQPVRI